MLHFCHIATIRIVSNSLNVTHLLWQPFKFSCLTATFPISTYNPFYIMFLLPSYSQNRFRWPECNTATIATIQIFVFNCQLSNFNSSVVKIAWWVWSLNHTKQFCSNKTMITRETWTSVKFIVNAPQLIESSVLRNTFYSKKEYIYIYCIHNCILLAWEIR